MARPAKLIRNRNFAILYTVEGLLLAGATVAGVLDPAETANRVANARWQWLACVFLIGSAWLVGRAWSVGVSVSGNELVKHGWFRNRRIPIADIRRAETANYDGAWSKGETRMLRLVTLWLTSGATIRLPELVGRPHTAVRLADEVSRACGIPVPS